MSDEQNTNNVNMEQPSAPQDKPSKSNLMKYITLGGGGFVLMLVIAFGMAFLLKPKQAAEPEASTQQATTKETHPAIPGRPALPPKDSASVKTEDSTGGQGQSDQTALDKITDNLAFLDYKPDSADLASNDETGMSVEDSLKQANWIKQKKDSLAAWEKSLNDRQKKLDRQQQEVDKKMLVLEQAEATRVTELAKLYDGMDARAVARLMTSLDDATVIAILPKMKVKNASQVLQLLPAQRAAKLSKQLITIAEK